MTFVRHKLLVVDDDETVLAAIAMVLRRAGYQVETTSDVFGLPIRIGGSRPDAVLLDVSLPAITGDQLAQSLRRVRSTKDIKIIFHSAEDEDKLRRLVAECQVEGYIPKGLHKLDFLTRLKNFLERQP